MLTKEDFHICKDKAAQKIEESKGLDSYMELYWKYYNHGINRNYHGTAFGSESIHTMRMRFFDSMDPLTQIKGQGYIDGLNETTEKIKKANKRRKEKTDGTLKKFLGVLRVSNEIFDLVIEASEILGVKPSVFRKEALKEKARKIITDHREELKIGGVV